MNADGSNQTRLTTNVDPEADVVASPTGVFVAFTSRGAGLDFSPDWSPAP
jgi:Tol biopolymer transport system component